VIFGLQWYIGGCMKTLSKQKTSSSKTQKGSVLVEFTFVLPLLLILFIGTLELGRTLNEASWLTQASYQSAKLGSENPSVLGGVAAMQNRANILKNLQNKFLDNDSITVVPAYDSEDGLVSTRISGTLRPLIPYFPITVSVESVGPHLLRTAGIAGNLNQFADIVTANSCSVACVSGIRDRIDYDFSIVPVSEISF